MSAPATSPADVRRNHITRWLVVISAVVIVGVLFVANAHLVYVAFTSQPDCVAHLKDAGDHGAYRAAKSAC